MFENPINSHENQTPDLQQSKEKFDDLLQKFYTKIENAQYNTALNLVDEMLENALDDGEQIIVTLRGKAFALMQLNKMDEALNAYNEITSRFAQSQKSNVIGEFLTALKEKATLENQLQKVEDEIQTYTTMIDILDEFISVNNLNEQRYEKTQENIASLLNSKASCLLQLENALEAYKVLVEFETRFDSSENEAIQEQLSFVLFNKGLIEGKQEQFGNEIRTYNKLIDKFANCENENILSIINEALNNKKFRVDRLSMVAYDKNIQEELVKNVEDPEEREVLKTDRIAYALKELDRIDELLELYENIATKFKDTQNSNIKTEILNFLREKASIESSLHRTEDEIKSYNLMIDILEDYLANGELEPYVYEKTLENLAVILSNKAACFMSLNQAVDAVKLCEQFEKRFEFVQNERVEEQLSIVLYNKAITFARINEFHKEIETYDVLLGKFKDTQNKTILTQVRNAMHNKELRLGHLDRNEERVYVQDELVEKFRNSPNENAQRDVLMTLMNEAMTLTQLDRLEEAVFVYDEVIMMFENNEEEFFQEAVASSIFHKSMIYMNQGKYKEELETYDMFIDKYMTTSNEKTFQELAKIFVNKGITTAQYIGPEYAVEIYVEAIRLFDDTIDPVIEMQVALASCNLGQLFAKLQKIEAAIEVYTIFTEKFESSKDEDILELVAKAMVNKGTLVEALNKIDEAFAIYDEVIEKFQHSEGACVNQVAYALYNKGVLYNQLNRIPELLMICDELIERFEHSQDESVLSLVSNVKVVKQSYQ